MLISYIEKKGRNKVKVTLADGESFMISEKDWNSFGEEAGRDIAEEILEKGVHYVEVALNEIPLFIRKGKCIPVAEAAECVAALDTKNMQLLGYEGAEYTLYEDDGVHKDYDREENYRVLKK